MKLWHRFLSLFLAQILILFLLPVSVLATEETTEPMEEIFSELAEEEIFEDPLLTADAGDTGLEELVRKQFLKYVSGFASEGASAGAKQMLKHAIGSSGSHLKLTEKDSFTHTIMRAGMLQVGMPHAVSAAIKRILDNGERQILMRGSFFWYDHQSRYSFSAYHNETGNKEDNVQIKPSIKASNKDYIRTMNSYDEAMLLVAGTCGAQFTVKLVSTTLKECRFRIDAHTYDDFDFNASYKSEDADLARLITALGDILSIGAFKPYDWESNFSFEVSVPNPCMHQSANYRWKFDGTNFVTVTSGGNTANPATRIQKENSKGELQNPYFQTEYTCRLSHDKPWVLEYRATGSGTISFTSEYAYQYSGPFLKKTNNTVYGIDPFPYDWTDQETGETTQKTGQNMYGYKHKKNIYKAPHTFRLENRIGEDGSNMVYFLVDGTELAALNTHYRYDVNGTQEIGQSNWFNGTDILVSHIFCSSYKMPDTMQVEYIQIWENGDSGEIHDYRTYKTIQPSHTSEGKQTVHCSLCGGTSVEILPETHDEKIIPGYAATCTEAGLFDGSVCTTCGKTVKKQETIPALGHKEKILPGTVTCTEPGLTEGRECTRCKKVLTAQQEMEALGHSWDEGTVTTPMTCTTSGTKTYTCQNDKTHTYTEEIPAAHIPVPVPGYAPTCTKIGLTDASKCDICGKVLLYHQSIPATGHTEILTEGKAATCTNPGLTEGKQCSVCQEILLSQTEIPPMGHTQVIDEAVDATCQKTGLTEGKHCSVCDTILVEQKEIPMTEHEYENGSCIHCGEADPDYIETAALTRIAGDGRCQTAMEAAEELKKIQGVEKFRTILVADGNNYPDALSGSYLAAVADAPILLVQANQKKVTQTVKEYILSNLTADATVYILGGTNSIPTDFEASIASAGYTVKRLAGNDRYLTSLMIIQEGDALLAQQGKAPADSLLVCAGGGYADSLSASATGHPVLLVNGGKTSLTTSQKAYLDTIGKRSIYIIGGPNSVSNAIATQLNAYDTDGITKRIAGDGREETSAKVAQEFFPEASFAVLADGNNYPDGLSGGPVAYAKDAPLLLIRAKRESHARDYVGDRIKEGYIMGGINSVSDESAKAIFGENAQIK